MRFVHLFSERIGDIKHPIQSFCYITPKKYYQISRSSSRMKWNNCARWLGKPWNVELAPSTFTTIYETFSHLTQKIRGALSMQNSFQWLLRNFTLNSVWPIWSEIKMIWKEGNQNIWVTSKSWLSRQLNLPSIDRSTFKIQIKKYIT